MQVPDFKSEALCFMQENQICPQEMVIQAIEKAMEHGFVMGVGMANQKLDELLLKLKSERPDEDSISSAHYLGKL